MNELSLVIQTVCLQAAVGIMLFLVLTRLWNSGINGTSATIVASVLAIVGVVTSITHLGQPLRAFNSLLNIGSSWLSRETLAVALFSACCVVCALVSLVKPDMKAALRVLELLSAAIGLFLLYTMASVYNFSSVPAWQGANTYIEYYSFAVIMGAALLFALTFRQQDRRGNKILGAVALAALTVQFIGSELHTTALATGGVAARMSAEILMDNAVLVAVKWVLVAVGVGVLCTKTLNAGAPKLAAVTAGRGRQDETAAETGAGVNFYLAWALTAAVVAAAFLAKVLFFSSMVVTGIGR